MDSINQNPGIGAMLADTTELAIEKLYRENIQYCMSFYDRLTKTDEKTRQQVLASMEESIKYPGAYKNDYHADLSNKGILFVTYDWAKYTRAEKGSYKFSPNSIIIQSDFSHDEKGIRATVNASIGPDGVHLVKNGIEFELGTIESKKWLNDFFKYNEWYELLNKLAPAVQVASTVAESKTTPVTLNSVKTKPSPKQDKAPNSTHFSLFDLFRQLVPVQYTQTAQKAGSNADAQLEDVDDMSDLEARLGRSSFSPNASK
jgi:hypothetical protein